jgi:hypothetical protein
MKRLGLVVVLLSTASLAMAGEDWAFELSPDAKAIYESKQVQVPCEEIPALLKANNNFDVFIAIRDAALFRDHSCGAVIQANRQALERVPGLKDMINFYYLQQGQKQTLQQLAEVFDREAKSVGDHPVVELFGFLPDWGVSGVRLVRHAAYADASGAETLCSAIMWRRYLHGERDFKEHWYAIGKKERVPLNRLDHFYSKCKRAP